jgi:hypothetical protein
MNNIPDNSFLNPWAEVDYAYTPTPNWNDVVDEEELDPIDYIVTLPL